MNTETTNAGVFHLHVDAKVLPHEIRDYALKIGFNDTDFVGHPEGYQHFEPNQHLTLKLKDKASFDITWAAIKGKVSDNPNFIGYLEGEWVPVDDPIDESPYRQVAVPFKINRRRLTPKEEFRQTEIHLSMDKDKSEQILIQNLLAAGLYGAYLPKQDYTAVVLTIQGFASDIRIISRKLRSYLREAGGAVRGTLKEEVAICHYLQGVTVLDLPEIASEVVIL